MGICAYVSLVYVCTLLQWGSSVGTRLGCVTTASTTVMMLFERKKFNMLSG